MILVDLDGPPEAFLGPAYGFLGSADAFLGGAVLALLSIGAYADYVTGAAELFLTLPDVVGFLAAAADAAAIFFLMISLAGFFF